MWRKLTPYIVVGSLGLNLAFVTVWFIHAWPNSAFGEFGERPAIWCPLHRSLQVTPRQWADIEPRLRAFQVSVGELCQQVDRARSGVIEMVAAEQPDLEAIRARQDEILAVKQVIQSRVVEHLLFEKEILSAGQQERLFEMLRQHVVCAADPPMSGRGSDRGRGQVPRRQPE
jgi:hypothetical protein